MKTAVRRTQIALALSIVSLPLAVSAQDATPSQQTIHEPLTLQAAVQQAADRYPAIRAAEAQKEAARNAIGVAQAAYLPRADMLWQLNRATTNKANLTPLGQGIVPIPTEPARATTDQSQWNTLTGVLFSWQPFDFGVRHAQVGVARFGYESARHAADLTKLDVESAAAGAFFDLVAARQLDKVQQANVQRMEAFSRSIHVLVDNTLRPGADASQADAQLAQARTLLIQAQTQEKVRLETLANLLQISSDQIQIDDAAVMGDVPASSDQSGSVEANPLVEQQTAIRDQAKEQLHLLNRSWVPSFSLYGSVSGLGAGLTSAPVPVFQGGTAGLAPQTYNWLAAAQVTFPAFQIFTLHPQQKAQQAQLSAAEANRTRVMSDVSAQLKEARALLAGARAVAQNTPVELDAARQSERQQQARYQAGLATVIEVSAAESALAQAEGDDAVARLNVWRGLAGVAEEEGDLNPFLQLLQRKP
ncbi:TolC family protein [Occallatibacter riparius]|uniref:TolC family protein n=1 Tax=Occallatibacter riparius TaxID=1002689 RepID=A0A9J7BPW5_9BACT|nr:TolC family protein [Occallatibacter riparius]UWZ84577.1 TolC family protein [Occallatibacter riparius]